ncbi:MAG: nuclear transport factor 2 family protein [Bacteroidetes bacterium]|nr:nuclear transport factor 2 family protein [Bacteroidota bacterium]
MESLRKLSIAIVIVCSFIIADSSFAQKWSSEQKEVWKSVEASWDLYAAGDLNGLISYIDKSFVGWDNNSKVPSKKSETVKFIRYFFPKSKILFHSLKPVAIWVEGDFAFVHYYYLQVNKNADGKENTETGRWTDILMKDGNRWVLVGDHGGRTK